MGAVAYPQYRVMLVVLVLPTAWIRTSEHPSVPVGAPAEVPVMVAASGVSAADLFLLSSAAKPDIGSYAQMVGHVEKSLTLLVQHKFATLQTL